MKRRHTDQMDWAKRLQKLLFSAFKLIDKSLNIWEGESRELIVSLTSITNLCEQFAACNSVDVDRTALRDFCGVQPNLLFKISIEVDKSVEKLRQQVLTLRVVSRQICGHQQRVRELYQRSENEMTIEMITARPDINPSLADMMEELDVFERTIRHQVAAKEFTIDNLKYWDSGTTGVLRECWESDTAVLRKLNGRLCTVRQFLMDGVK